MSLKKKILLFTCLTLSFPLFSFEIENQRIGLSTEMLYHRYKQKQTLPNRNRERGVIYGAGISYDVIFNNSLYTGGDLKGSTGETVYDGSSGFRSKTDSSFVDIQLRAGKALFYNEHIIIPYFTCSWSRWNRNIAPEHSSMEEKLSYYLPYIGIGTRYTLSKGQFMSFSLKAELSKAIKPNVKNHTANRRLKLGSTLFYKVELPLSYHDQNWLSSHLSLTPYIYFTQSKKGQLNEGQFEPQSNRWQFGLRFEIYDILKGGSILGLR